MISLLGATFITRNGLIALALPGAGHGRALDVATIALMPVGDMLTILFRHGATRPRSAFTA